MERRASGSHTPRLLARSSLYLNWGAPICCSSRHPAPWRPCYRLIGSTNPPGRGAGEGADLSVTPKECLLVASAPNPGPLELAFTSISALGSSTWSLYFRTTVSDSSSTIRSKGSSPPKMRIPPGATRRSSIGVRSGVRRVIRTTSSVVAPMGSPCSPSNVRMNGTLASAKGSTREESLVTFWVEGAG